MFEESRSIFAENLKRRVTLPRMDCLGSVGLSGTGMAPCEVRYLGFSKGNYRLRPMGAANLGSATGTCEGDESF
jgi:hypothetical protein